MRDQVVAHSRVEIKVDKVVRVFKEGEVIPDEFANQAIAEGKGTLEFVTERPYAQDASR